MSSSLRSDLALDALEQALHARAPADDLVHHSDGGGQYLSIRYAERLAEAAMTNQELALAGAAWWQRLWRPAQSVVRVRHDEAADRWDLTMFQRAQP